MSKGDFPWRPCKLILKRVVVPQLSNDVTNTRSDREARRLDMQSNGVNPASVSGKAADFGEPWEDGYRYVTADRIGETIHVSDQLSYKNKDNVIAPDSPDKACPVAMPLTSRFWRASGQR
jgi:hypothetical protein